MTTLHLATTGVIGLVGLVMVAEGGLKLVGADSQVEGFREFGYPQWFRLVVGGLELLGGIGLLVGLMMGPQWLVLGSGTVLAVVLAGAVATHLRVGDPIAEGVPAGILLVLCVAGVTARTQVLM